MSAKNYFVLLSILFIIFSVAAIAEEAPAPEPAPAPAPEPAPTPQPPPAECKTTVNEKGCTIIECTDGKRSESCPPPSMPVCPQISFPGPDFCKDGRIEKRVDNNGCISGYDCFPISKETPVPITDYCSRVVACIGGDGCCPSGCSGQDPDCGPQQKICPQLPTKPICDNGNIVPKYDNNGCLTFYECQPSFWCPTENRCPDGSQPCQIINNNCECKSCPPPQGCREEKDPSGFVRVICENKQMNCPPDEDLKHAIEKCNAQNGRWISNQDARGCKYIDCEFGETKSMFATKQACPQLNFEEVRQKCESLNQRFEVYFENGCKIPKCIQGQERACPEIMTPSIREEIESKCKSQGMGIVKDFDNNGCPITRCGRSDECQRELPQSSYEKCKTEYGGELIVKTDQRGCIVYRDCVRRGDEKMVIYEEVTEKPSATTLLDIAFKLENLKIEFDKLARQTDDVANYYKSVGSGEEERFRRVSDMFDAAKTKVDEIKTKIKDRMKDMTTDDLGEIKHDIKYIKEVMMQDIVYYMLSSSDDVKQITSKTEDDCGYDESCFDQAFRVCKKVKFKPPEDGGNGPDVEIIGLEGDKCVMKATSEGPGKKPMEMTCKIPNYALGIKEPEKDIFPYCEGAMAEFLKKYGTEGPSGPGGCKGQEECDSYCSKNQQVCMDWCKQNPDLCPEQPQGQGGTGPSQPAQRETLINFIFFIFDSEGNGPGGCYKDSCVEYCTPRQQECLDYAETQLKNNGGPGGARSIKEVTEFCNKTENRPICEDWVKPRMAFLEKYKSSFSTLQQSVVQSQRTGSFRCGDGLCEPDKGENEFNCYDDCLPDGKQGFCGDGRCDSVEVGFCPRDCSVSSGGGGGQVQPATTQNIQQVSVQTKAVKACSGCLDNGVCDVGECDGCKDCLK